MNRKLTKQQLRPGLRLRPMAQNMMLALGVGLYASNGFALPQGAQVVAGTASIVQQGDVLTVSNSANAILNWQNFNIGVGELTRFVQPSAASAVLNRVVGGDPSAILGTLTSNGRVFLINPTGIIFGAGAKIDTAGFVASTLNITDQNFLQGKLQFEGQGGRILNEGDIKAIGSVYLVAPDIQNSGTIKSENGSVVLAAGQKVLLSEADPNQVVFEVQAPESSALNLGNIEASKSVGVFANSLTHSGAIKAVDMVAGEGGKVVLTGASVKLTSGSSIDVSAPNKGGTVLVGGDYQGKNPDVRNATTTVMERDATIRADATQNGDGGKVILWADDKTVYSGRISARGGEQGGDGGFVETSGHQKLSVGDEARVDTRAPQGKAGTWLLDPNNFVIAPSAGDTTGTLLSTNLNSTDIAISSNDGGSGVDGDIFVNDTVSWSSPYSLTLNAVRDVNVNNAITYDGSSAPSLTLNAGRDINLTGSIANIGSGGGTLNTFFSAAGQIAGTGTLIGGQVAPLHANLTASGGINLQGNNQVNTANLNNTGAGNIQFNNTIDPSVPLLLTVNNSGGDVWVNNTLSALQINGNSGASGMVSLQAGGAITQSVGTLLGGTSLRVSGASVDLPEANAVGVIAGSTTSAGNFTYRSVNQVTLSTVDGVYGINAGSGGVTLTSDNFGINQLPSPFPALITANNLSTSANNGINLNLENQVSNFDGQTTTGDIFLRNATTLSIVNPIRAYDGSVIIDSTGWMVNVTGNMSVIDGKNGVSIYAGYLYMDDAGTQTISSAEGSVSLVANSFWLGSSRTISAPSVRITTLDMGRPINIVSNAAYSGCQSGGTSLCLDAAQLDSGRITSPALTIGSNVSEPIPGSVNFGPSGAITISDAVNRNAFDLYLLSGGDISQTAPAPIQAATLGVASSGGNVSLVSSNSVSNIVGMVPVANNFDFLSSGPITVSSVTPFGGTTYSGVKAGNVSLNSLSGSISVNNPIVSSGYVSFEAYGDINGSALISGTDLFLTSTMGNLGLLNTAVSTLDASASFGTISVSNTGNLTIQNQLETMGSSINVTTTGDLTVATETLVSVGSGSGGATLALTSTGGKIDILPLATLSALGGSINLSASSDVNIGIGGTVEPNVATIDATGGTVTVTSTSGVVNRDPTAVIFGTYNEVLPPVTPVIVPPSETSSESETVQAPITQIVALTEGTTGGTTSSTTSDGGSGDEEMTEEEKRAAAEAAGQTSGTETTTTSSAGVPACQ